MITRKQTVGAIRYLVLSATGAFLLWLTFRNQDLHEIVRKIEQANILYIIVSVVIGFGAFLIRAYRWNMLIEPLGFRPRLSHAAYALGIGYFANLAIPRIGEISRCGVLSRTDRIPMEKLFGTVITERIIDLVMLAFSMLLLAVLEFSLFSGFMRDKIVAPLLASSGGSLTNGTIWAAAAVLAVLATGLVYRFRRTALVLRIAGLLRGFAAGLSSVVRMRRLQLFAVHTVLMWFLYYLATYACFFALDSTADLGARQGLFILVAGGLGMSAPVQGGIGAYHYIVSQALLLFGVALTDGIVYATLVHSAQLALIVVTGCVSLVMVMRTRRADAAGSAPETGGPLPQTPPPHA